MNIYTFKPLYDMIKGCWVIIYASEYDNGRIEFNEFNEAYSVYLESFNY